MTESNNTNFNIVQYNFFLGIFFNALFCIFTSVIYTALSLLTTMVNFFSMKIFLSPKVAILVIKLALAGG